MYLYSLVITKLYTTSNYLCILFRNYCHSIKIIYETSLKPNVFFTSLLVLYSKATNLNTRIMLVSINDNLDLKYVGLIKEARLLA